MLIRTHKVETDTFSVIIEPLKGRPGAYLKQGASFIMIPEDAYPDLLDALEQTIYPDRPAALSPAKAIQQLGVLHVHPTTENQP